MISFGVYGDVSLAQARAKRDEARSMLAKGINPSEARKAEKIALQFAHENSFESVAREWHGSKKPRGQKGTQKKFSTAWKRTFSLYRPTPIEQIEPLELLTVLQKIEKRGALEQTSKIRRRCGEVLRYAVATGRAKYNFAPDLAIALNKPKTQHFPFLTESELPAFVSALENYQGSLVTKYATQLLMLTGVEQSSYVPRHGSNLI
jgi:integrase